MATSQIILTIWLTLVTALWSLHPLLFSHARGVVMLSIVTGLLAVAGWSRDLKVLVFWSGIVGLLNMTLVLLLTAQPPSFWIGLSAGLTLFALLDGSQRYAYVRRCRVERGVLAAMLDTFIRLSGLCIVTGLAIGAFLVVLSPSLAGVSLVGLLTLAGASLFAGFFTLFMLYTNRPSGDENRY